MLWFIIFFLLSYKLEFYLINMVDCIICMVVCIEDLDGFFKLKKVIGLNLNVYRYSYSFLFCF